MARSSAGGKFITWQACGNDSQEEEYINHPDGQAVGRLITHNIEDEESTGHFASNEIRTAKYNLFTFFPRFLFEMFKRAAYMYFLLQVGAPGCGTLATDSPGVAGLFAKRIVVIINNVSPIGEGLPAAALSRRDKTLVQSLS